MAAKEGGEVPLRRALDDTKMTYDEDNQFGLLNCEFISSLGKNNK